MRFLLDTNVIIPLEPTSSADIEEFTGPAAEFVKFASELEVRLLVHPESIRELTNDQDPERRRTRQLLVKKYLELENPPGIERVENELGRVSDESHDYVDHLLLAALAANAVHNLVTSDTGIHRKARQLGLQDRVLSIAGAREFLGALGRRLQRPPPRVSLSPLHSLDNSDPIFRSLREDYRDFDDWFGRVSREGRQAWVIDSPEGGYAGICIWKDGDDQFGLGGKVMKVSTFKISEQYRGRRYGELLLKALFSHLRANNFDKVWLTVFDRHAELVTLLEEFGFEQHSRQTALGELVMVKHLKPAGEELLGPFEYHRRHGPPAVNLALGGGVYVIPIQPTYHTRLFPDHPGDPVPLFPRDDPFGHALRKAYISRSGITELRRGSTVFFYRSSDWQAISAVGVVEGSMRSDDPFEIAAFATQRTVYTISEIEEMTAPKALAIRFRQDRLLEERWALKELLEAQVLSGPPQSITQIKSKERIAWLSSRLAESS